ncbi:MAG: (Fe-S)-binding protein, partial [Synergistaceae bacterium]|nr:(Fe-S)-binding protein [Synergistaceae bacterium]
MFSNDARQNAEACRFCWMCRHICPTGAATGNEAFTPRGRGLLASMVERGTKFDGDMAGIMYTCCLCDACANDCVTGFKPSAYIREARTQAVVAGLEPAEISRAIGNIHRKNNIYGLDKRLERMENAVKDLPERADVLVYLGQTAWYKKDDEALALLALLNKAGVTYTVLADEPASGSYMAELMGYTGDVQEMAVRLAKRVEDSNAKSMVVLNPHDAAIFIQEYPKWGLLEGVRSMTATRCVAQLLEDKKLTPQKVVSLAATHDPCKLSRALDETESIRIIAGSLGMELKELFLNQKLTRCCGGVPLSMYKPAIVTLIARER